MARSQAPRYVFVCVVGIESPDRGKGLWQTGRGRGGGLVRVDGDTDGSCGTVENGEEGKKKKKKQKWSERS